MAFTFDWTADFFTLDNLRPLVLRVAGQADRTISAAIDQPADWKDPERAGGNVLEGDQLWIWPMALTPARPPLGAVLIDADGTAWTILAITKTEHVNTYEAHCRNLSVAARLDNTATVLKASYMKSPGGEALPTWTQVLSVPARFQPVDETAQILEDAEWPKTIYHVILGLDIFAPEVPVEPASADYRLVDSAGRHYRIVQYQRAERIDVLPLAVCVLVIEGSEGGAVDRLSSSGS